ncbi:LLM class flavin-dependent oxidoreductase [Amycolatopsis sp. lyj-23]|uniref:LLM class flavin-dependent oxidoreductase n=1 Tax=Amycolatopsis sp. lyj-23 TaxID=2789283 RepID=UPI00397C43F3
MPEVPLSVLDLVPVGSGSGVAEAVRNTVDLARHAERFGYHRYWFAEHHLNPGVAGASPPVLIALVAGATERIRLGSAGVQLAHRTPLATVEEFGLIDALHPGRLDLGLGRSGKQLVREYAAAAPRAAAAQATNGLLIPPKPDFSSLARSPRLGLTFGLLQQPGAEPPGYAEQVDDILALLRGTYRSADGLDAHAVPGEGARPQVWILGSSGGQSASVAGRNSLRFAANYHVSPATVLEAVDAYRAAFHPSDELPRPYVAVSADVVVAEDDATARRLAAGYALWVRSIRRAEGAIPFPTPEEAAAHRWSDEDRALVADRVDTQFTGSPATVAARLRQLREATGADELVVTTITHDHADRVRSYELLAGHWFR